MSHTIATACGKLALPGQGMSTKSTSAPWFVAEHASVWQPEKKVPPGSINKALAVICEPF